METRLHRKVDSYFTQFKHAMVDHVKHLNISPEEKNEYVNFIYEYKNLHLEKDDFMKRRRIKNVVPLYARCMAKKANEEQCTRRRKESFSYCGTHVKGTPHVFQLFVRYFVEHLLFQLLRVVCL